jgi:hypothetical protein
MKKNVRGLDSNTLLSHKVQNPIIPVTVQDQIRLWGLERHRVKGQDGKLPEKAKYASQLNASIQAIYTKTLDP